MSKQFTFTTELGEDEAEIEITYSVSPYWPATREQPAEGGEVELISAKIGGIEVRLSPEDEAELLEKCEARAREDLEAYAAEAAEYRAEMRAEALLEERWQP